MSNSPDCFSEKVSALIECAESAGPDSSYLGILRDVCFMSAEAVGADDVPIEKILPCVLKKFTSVCSTLVDKAKPAHEVALKEVVKLLEVAVGMIESVRSLVAFLNSEELIVLEDVLTPVPLSLDIVQTSYGHLKESEKIYGPYFNQLEHCLVQLSSETMHLQMLLLGMLEKVKVEVSCEKHVVWLLGICRRLRDLGITLQGLDLKMLVSVRKFLVKTSLQYRDSLKNRLDIDQLLSDLCTYVVEWLSSLKQLGPAKDGNFTVEMKTAAFHIRLLDSLISKYGGYFDNCLKMVALMIASLSGLPISANYFLNLGPAQIDGLLRHIWIAAEHLVSVLAESRDFCIVVLTLDVPEDLWCGYQLMLTTLMDYVVDCDDALRACLPTPGSGDKNILEAVFGAIDHCSLEFQLPVSLESSGENGKPPRSIGLYEHLCTRTCRFLAALSPEHFGIAEAILFRNVLRESHWSACLASDTLCFVARFGSPQLCFEHAKLLARLVNLTSSAPGNKHSHAKSLLRRLSQFLIEEHKTELHQMFSSNSVVTSIVGLPESTSTARAQAVQLLMKLSAKTIGTSELKILVRLLCQMKESSRYKEHCLPAEPLLQALSSVPAYRSQLCCDLTHAIIDLLTAQITSMKGSVLVQVLNALEVLFASGVDFIQVSIVLSLISWGKLGVLPSLQKQEILHKLSRLFASSLSSGNYVVQQTALHAFAQFAQATQYDAVISNAIEHPTLKALVTSFLTKDEMKTPFDWVTVVRTQLQVVESSATDDYDCSSSDWSGSDDTDPNPEKRPKCEDNLNELFESIEAAVSKLRQQDKGALQSRRSKLQWLQSQLNNIVEDL
ncbi:uncharacterized protein ISCGN_015763 [Ixodes scapularis]